MESPREKFQNLLRELFQFDCADLDFGIYRIMNHKHEVIERFIIEDLPKAIGAAISREALAKEAEARRKLEEAAGKVRETLGAGALDTEGELLEIYHGSPLGREYLELREELASYRGRPDREAEIYNHLYTFFSRYYQDGDFVAKRRYSRREKYAIPYNGEEVYLYWANHDQYYVKTAEYFRDYAFTAKGVTVHFRLEDADVEQDNVKGEKRFFLPRPEGMAWDEASSRLVIPFAYRPLTEEEEKIYGEKNQQEAINARALVEIPKRLAGNTPALAALVEMKREGNGGGPVSNLEAHLRRYTRRNTADFFIHKDLKGFLTRELDFYLKNEVLNLGEVEAAGEERAEGWFQMMRIIREIGGRIIEFLAQIEDFQKMLWEKRKFVTETQYCITIGSIPENFYPEIAACEAQWDEWKALFHIQEEQGVNLFTAGLGRMERRIAFLKDHPTLVLDTRHFERGFVDRLLASFADLDEATDGLLVHGENFQALNLLLEKYRGKVKCVYIDPPYNRGGDDFLYKDDYRHSSWLSMMLDRMRAAVPLLNRHGVLFVHIDENERDNLQAVLDLTLGRRNRLEELIWVQNTTHSQSPLYSTNHEYVEVYACDRSAVEQDPVMFREPKPGYAELMALVERLNPAYPPISEVEREIQALMAQHLEDYKAELRAMGLEYDEETKKQDPWRGIYNYCHAEYRDAKGRLVAEEEARKRGAKLWIWREDNPSAPTQKQAESTRDPDDPNFRFYRPIHPKTGKPCEIPKRGWAWPYTWVDGSRESFESLDRAGRIVWGEDETKIPQYKRFLHDVETNVAKSVFHDYTDGEKQIAALFGATGIFPTPKPTTLLERFAIQTCGGHDLVLDFFAGSGTTGQAVIEINREDGGRRRFILVEMADYFDTVLLPRIKKVIFAPEWKDGRPARMATREEAARSPRIVKYIRLESYEDALNNISFEEAPGRMALEFEDYFLRYMLKWEARRSETMLNVEKLERPFAYRLHLYADGRTGARPVDLPETFNFLLGLHVTGRRALEDGGRRYLVYHGRRDHRTVAVIWRETAGWSEADYEREKEFLAKQGLVEGADEIFTNGESVIPGARSLDGLFKSRMFGGTEAWN